MSDMTTNTDKTRQEELRGKIARTKTFNYDVYFGQDITNDCIPFEEALDEIQALVNQQVLAALDKVKSTAVENVNGAMVVGVHSIEDIEKEYKV